MRSPRSEREAQRLRRVAAGLEREGFETCVEPGMSALPVWLRPFRPDLIARRGKEGVVVEVKSREDLHGDASLRELAAAIEDQPNWRLQLDISNPRDSQREAAVLRAASERYIEDQLRASSQLLDAGLQAPALINGWAAFEGAARRVMEGAGEPAPPANTSALLRTLWAHGYLEPKTRDRLRELANARNQVVHGTEPTKKLRSSDTKALHRITRELLAAAQ